MGNSGRLDKETITKLYDQYLWVELDRRAELAGSQMVSVDYEPAVGIKHPEWSYSAHLAEGITHYTQRSQQPLLFKEIWWIISSLSLCIVSQSWGLTRFDSDSLTHHLFVSHSPILCFFRAHVDNREVQISDYWHNGSIECVPGLLSYLRNLL